MAGIRRTWDKAHYEALAKDRIARGDIEEEEREKEGGKTHRSKDEFQRADDNEAGPAGSERAYLRARESKVDIESKVGVIEVLKPNTAAHAAGPGWFCETCDCLLKDSASYLNHINGRKHQRALGFSMRVERAGVDQVKERLDLLKRKISDKASAPKVSASEEYENKLALQLAEEERLKRQRKEEAIARKKEKEIADMDDADPEIAALMGFGTFTKKK